MFRRWILPFILVVVAGSITTPTFGQSMSNIGRSNDSLYKRVGGYDAIAAVTDDFLGRMLVDPQLKKFFVGFNDDSRKRIRQHIMDFLCQTAGGPCAYHGREMKTAHAGISIREQDWQAAVNDLQATFDKFKVPDRERNELLTAIAGLKGDIVQ